MIRSLLRGFSDTDNFVDDIMVHTENWDRQIAVLQELLKTLRDAQLTARPTKCIIAVNQVGFRTCSWERHSDTKSGKGTLYPKLS